MATYNEDYLDQCFQVWYASGQIMDMERLKEMLPKTLDGSTPSAVYLRSIIERDGWFERADSMNAIVSQKVDTDLMKDKYEMLKRQALRTMKIAEKAYDFILENGFDTSNSAISAYFKSTEEERLVTGLGKTLLKINTATNEELKEEALKLLRRVNESDEVNVEGEILDMGEEVKDADSGGTTSN